MRCKITLFLVLLQALALSGYGDDFEPVADLSSQWFFNDNETSLPYVKGNNTDPVAIHFKLNLARYAGNYLIISHPHPTVLFVDGKIFSFAERQGNFRLPVDSLYRVLNREQVLVTVFSEMREYDQLSTTISAETFFFESQGMKMAPEPRVTFERSDLFIILLLLAVFYALTLNTNRKSMQDFYSVEQALSGRIKDDSVYRLKLFAQNNLLIFLFHASVISFLMVVLTRYSDFHFTFEKYLADSDFVNWLLLSVIIFFAFFLKYILIKYLGELFDLGSSANYYFYEFMRLSMNFFMALLIVASIVLIGFPYLAGGMIRMGLTVTFVFMFVRLIFIFMRIARMSGFKNVHLFSYLCTTETLPIIIGIKYFLS